MFMFNLNVPLTCWVKVSAHHHKSVVQVRTIVEAHTAKMNVVKIGVMIGIGCVSFLSWGRLSVSLPGTYEQ